MVEADRPVDLTGARLGEVESALQEALLAERERAAFLAEASRALAGSLNLRRTVPRVLGIVVPRLGVAAQVTVAGSRSVTCTGSTASGDSVLERVVTRPAARERTGLARVLRTGRLDLAQVASPDEATPWLPDDELRAALVPDVPCALASVPLIARGTVFGTLTVLRPIDEGGYDERELSLLEDLGQRAALAVDAARLYTERSHVATVLQASLRPPRLPEVPGVLLAARYRPAYESNEIGGDFYDIHGRDDDWSVVVGDVMGKGVEAAVLTGQARQTIRTAGLVDRSPDAILSLLNAALLENQHGRDATKFATAAVARLRRRPDRSLLADVANAGHPLPIVVRADGRVEQVGTSGMIVGVFDSARYDTTTTSLAPGDLLLLYTDGITEARGPRGELGVEGLLRLLPDCVGTEPTALVEHVEQSVMEHLDGAPHDDIALLALGPTREEDR